MRFSPQEISTAVRLYDQGVTGTEIAKKLGRHFVSVYTMLRRETDMRRRGRPLFDFAQERRLCKLHTNQGLRPSEIASRLSISSNSARGILVRYGVYKSRGSRIRYIHNRAFSRPTAAALYWAGLLLADGCIRGPDVTLSLVDHQHVVLFRDFLESDYKIGFDVAKGRSYTRISIRSPQIVEDLARWGIVERKTLRATAKGEAVTSRHFWRGMIDGDGCLFFSSNTPGLRLVGSRTVCEQFAAFSRNCGVKDTYTVKKHGSIWKFSVYGDAARRMAKVLYQNSKISLARKKLLAESMMT